MCLDRTFKSYVSGQNYRIYSSISRRILLKKLFEICASTYAQVKLFFRFIFNLFLFEYSWSSISNRKLIWQLLLKNYDKIPSHTQKLQIFSKSDRQISKRLYWNVYELRNSIWVFDLCTSHLIHKILQRKLHLVLF